MEELGSPHDVGDDFQQEASLSLIAALRSGRLEMALS